MRRLIRADLRRFFSKPGFYLLIIFLIVETLFITYGETAAEQIEELHGQVNFWTVLVCFLTFNTLYGDEARTGFMATAIGRGHSRAKIVVSKLITASIVLFISVLIAFATSLLMNSDPELAVSERQNCFLFLFMLYAFLKGVGYMAIASLFLFSSGSIALGIAALVTCSVFGVVLYTVQTDYLIPVYDICYDGLLEKSYTVFHGGAFGWQIIPAVIIYILGSVYLTVKSFEKRELEL